MHRRWTRNLLMASVVVLLPSGLWTRRGWAQQPDDWLKTGTVTIMNEDHGRLDNQVRLVVRRAAGMKEDYADLRFHDEDGTALPHWIETADKANAVVWLKLPQIRRGATQITFRYHNDAAAPKSDGDRVFLFFDNFADGFDKDKWWRNRDAADGGCGAFCRDGLLHVYGGDNNAPGQVVSQVDLPSAVTVECRIQLQRANDFTRGSFGLKSRDQPSECGIRYTHYKHQKPDKVLMANRDSFYPVAPGLPGQCLRPYWNDVWFRQRLSYDGRGGRDNLVFARDKGEGEEKLAATVNALPGALRVSMKPWAWQPRPTHRYLVDWVAVRKYQRGRLILTVQAGDAAEPTVTEMDDGPPPDPEEAYTLPDAF